jgi:membrane-associated phospholipid phosphatase
MVTLFCWLYLTLHMNQAPELFGREAYRHFRIAVSFSLALAFVAGLFVYLQGKQNSFLLINHFHSTPFDHFFEYYTFLGDGLLWIPLLFYVIAKKRSFIVPVLLAFLVCTLLTQFSKWVIYADAMRPLAELKNQVRTIAGIDVHSTSSFPSGHTSSAFTFALILAFLVKRTFFSFFFPLAAFFVGYSRVYLAQHFVTDVFAGIIVGLISAFLALVFHAQYLRYKHR